MRAVKDRYGFFFWLTWILWFAGSFVLAAVFWTLLMKKLFGEIFGAELTMTWVVSVFGSWFLLVIPFMRKKEQIWKRLNEDQERSVDAWFRAMSLFIGFLAASLFFWTWKLFPEISGSVGMHASWMKAVFVSWLLILVPFLIFMYRQADNIFKTAEVRQIYTPKFKSTYVEPSRRLLSDQIVQQLKNIPAVLRDGHLVHAKLKDGRRVTNLFIFKGREVLGIYDAASFDFSAQDIVSIEPLYKEGLSTFDEQKWLRIDGKS